MNTALAAALGVAVGVSIGTRLVPANTGNCCARVAAGARDQIAEATGPFAPLTAFALNLLGITPHLPRLLDDAGVPI